MLLDRYNEAVDALIAKVRTTQRENIIKAGELIANTVAAGGNIYLSKICHSIENDLIYRGGGPIFYRHFAWNMNVEKNRSNKPANVRRVYAAWDLRESCLARSPHQQVWIHAF